VTVGINERPPDHNWNTSPLVERGDTDEDVALGKNELLLVVWEGKSGGVLELLAVKLRPLEGGGLVDSDRFGFYDFHYGIDDPCLGGGNFDLSRSAVDLLKKDFVRVKM
jgi:hypothetical protein